LGENHVGVGWGWDIVHIEVEKDGRYDGALWNTKVNVSMGGEGMLEKNLLFSNVEVIAKEFGGGFREGGLEEFYFERGEIHSVESLSEVQGCDYGSQGRLGVVETCSYSVGDVLESCSG
jgi:hypothetical protein